MVEDWVPNEIESVWVEVNCHWRRSCDYNPLCLSLSLPSLSPLSPSLPLPPPSSFPIPEVVAMLMDPMSFASKALADLAMGEFVSISST